MIRSLEMRSIAFLVLLPFIASVPMENVLVVEGVGRFSRLLGMLIGGLWCVTVVTSGRFRRPRPFHALVLLFVLWNALTLFWTIDLPRTLNRVSTWVQLAVMVAVLWDLITTRRQLHLAYQAFVVGAYFSAFSTIQVFLRGDMYYNERYAAAGFHPNGLGIILVMGIPIAWYLATDRTERQHALRRLLNFGYAPIAAIGVALTGTRTAVVAAVPAMIYIGFGRHGSRQATAAMAVAGALALGLGFHSVVPAASFQRLATIGTEFTEGDFNGRVQLWRAGLEIFREHSLVGIGSDAFRSAEGKVAHNAFVSVAVESGAIGFLLFAAILGLVFHRASTLPPPMAHFLLALLLTWVLGASALTWEHKKTTWLIMSFVILSVHASAESPEPAGDRRRPRQLAEHG